jgi:Na+/pantothenate symporter
VVTFFVPIVGGIYVHGMNERGAAASIVAGLIGLFAAWTFITPAYRWADPVLVGVFAAVVAAAAVVFARKTRRPLPSG